jgi:ribulose 1,5-bisphosphate synthetase/thiazole synthase
MLNRMIQEPPRETPVVAEADVVVCGGGPGGFPAAVAAARHGAKVLLIERYGFMGGLATAGLVAPILGHKAERSNTACVEGLLKEMVGRMHAINGAPPWEEALQEWGVRFDAEAMKIVMDEMCLEAGVELMLHTVVADVIKQDDRIIGVIVENKSGRQAVLGRLFVDGTGDADVAYRAGARTTLGRPFDGRPMAMGSFFQLAGLAPVSAERATELRALIKEQMAKGQLNFYNPGFLAYNAYHKDHTSANMTRFGGDSSNARDMTQAELSIRGDIWKLARYLRANVPGFEDCYVQQTSPQVGPRESRQIVGPYVLTGDDVQYAHKFDDTVARGGWWIDIHCPMGNTYPVHLCEVECPKGEECPFWASEHTRMRTHDQLHLPPGEWYDIPYRSLLSVDAPNLLSSGRCISATPEAMAGTRVMGSCIAIGQAAGTAAALAAKRGVAAVQVDIQELRAALRADGALV